MKNTIASLSLGIALLGAPLAASASDTPSAIQYILGQVAALTAQLEQRPVACAVATDKAQVKVGETFSLVWNSVGAKEPSNTDTVSQWQRGGSQILLTDRVGTIKYKLTFYAPTGEEATCTTSIRVVSAQ